MKEEIRLSKLRKQDLEARVRIMNYSEVSQYMDYETPILLDKTIQWFENNINSNRRADFAIMFGETIVGMCGLTDIVYKHLRSELYIFLDPNYQGKGIGGSVLRCLLNYGFIDLSLNKIYLTTHEKNHHAEKLYCKFGFIKEGTFKDHRIENNKKIAVNYWGLLKSEWLNNNK